MSWICKRCETENPDTVDVCEVCDAKAPRIVSFSYNKVLLGSPITINWESEYCNNIIIAYEGNQFDVSKEKSYKIENPTATEIAFLLSNDDTTTRTVCFNLEILKRPTIFFISDKIKLRKDKGENIKLSWSIENALSAKLIESSKSVDISMNGEKQVVPNQNTIYKIQVVALDEKTIFDKELKIAVFEECKIVFSADKEYVFPSLPVLLTWNVSNANKVWLGSEEVEPCGSKIVEPTSDTVYILQAKDEFGMKNERLTIKTFPIKQANILLASPPNFTIKQNLTIHQPRYNVGARFPQIDIDWVKLEVPQVEPFKGINLDKKLFPPLPKSNFNLMSSIKNVFNHIIRK